MSTNEERREAAKRKLEERLEAERQEARRKRITYLSIAGVLVVAIAAAIGFFSWRAWDNGRHVDCSYPEASESFDATLKLLNEQLAAAPARPVPADPATGQAAQQSKAQVQAAIDYLEEAKTKLRDEPSPPTRVLKDGKVTLTFGSDQGPIVLNLDRSMAPCSVSAMISLAKAGYYDAPCHLLFTGSPLDAVGCGDPTGSILGNPGWFLPDETPDHLPEGEPNPMTGASDVTYPRGSVIMLRQLQTSQYAPTSDNGNGQFFILLKDTPAATFQQLPFGGGTENLTMVGKADNKTIDILAGVAEAGTQENPLGFTEPKTPLVLTSAKVSE